VFLKQTKPPNKPKLKNKFPPQAILRSSFWFSSLDWVQRRKGYDLMLCC